MIAYDMQMQIEQQSNIFEHEITKGNDFQKSLNVNQKIFKSSMISCRNKISSMLDS